MTGYRRAAVALHGLSGDDREWILSELPHEDGRRVKEYLQELTELGFAEDLLSGDVPALVRRPTYTGKDRASAVLRKAAVARVFAVVEAEPAPLVGRLLAMRDWPWSDELLKMFPPTKQKQIRVVMNKGSSAAPVLDKFLLERLAARLNGDIYAGRHLTERWLARLSASFSRMVRSWSR